MPKTKPSFQPGVLSLSAIGLRGKGGMFVLGWVLCSELVLLRLGPQQHGMRSAGELSTFSTSARAPRKDCGAFSSFRSRLPGLQSDQSLTCNMASRHDMLGNEPAASYSRSYLPDDFGFARGYRGGDRWVDRMRSSARDHVGVLYDASAV